MRTVLFLAVLAFPILAQQPEVRPPDPTSTTPVTLIVHQWASCPPPPDVSRNGTKVTVALHSGPCLSPPIEIIWELPLGVLPPGDYEVIFTQDDSAAGTFWFLVRDAGAEVVVRPSIGPVSGGTRVSIFADVRHCQGQPLPPPCAPPLITFDGVAATNVEALDSSNFLATTPAHAAGPAELRILNGEFTKTASAAFRYYDTAAAPPSSMFERVLIPVYFNGPGAFGSQWKTDLSVRNDNAYAVTPFGRSAVPARMSQPLTLDEPAPAGAILFIPRESSDALHFGALVRDTSRQAVDWGTEIPVVRERDFLSAAFYLLNVPRDPKFRLTLRIYGMDSVNDSAGVAFYSMSSGQRLGEFFSVPLTSANPCVRFVPCPSHEPAYAMIGDFQATFPGISGTDPVAIRIEPHSEQPIWAFVTITNNETQHVTTISPQ